MSEYSITGVARTNRPPKPEQVARVMAKMRHKFPAAFSTPRPLCVGIYQALICGLWPSNCEMKNPRLFAYGQKLSAALDQWCKSPDYLRACVCGAPRFDLTGEVCGEVSAEEAHYAATELQRRTR